jgi:hypothetical protein
LASKLHFKKDSPKRFEFSLLKRRKEIKEKTPNRLQLEAKGKGSNA